MRKTWSLSVGKDIWQVSVRKEPRWAQLVESAWSGLCWLTRGWAGGHGMPEWAWKIPMGRSQWDRSFEDEEPFLTNSLAGRLNDLEQWMLSRTWQYGRDLAVIVIPENVARYIDPEFVAEHDEWSKEDKDDEED